MNEYICQSLPSKLYRVHYPTSRTAFSTEHGFEASDTITAFGPDKLNEFISAIQKHFTWGCRDPLPFISLFSDCAHAENWGCKEPWSGHSNPEGSWVLYTVNTIGLDSKSFFKLSDLVEKFDLEIPKGAKQHIHGAYVCLYHIPATAIVEKRTSAEVEIDRESRQEPGKGRWDYLGDYGDDDSDREMLQENYNTIFERNMENNWD